MRVRNKNLRVEPWDGKRAGNWTALFKDTDAVVNLVGEGISDRPWTMERKFMIKSSRIDATRVLVSMVARARRRPKVFVSGSAVGFYGSVPDGEVTEDSPKGKGFLSGICSDWEHEAEAVRELGVRLALLRTGIVIERRGGALKKLMLPFRYYLGGPLGSGRQGFPWVHREDVLGAILHIIQNETLSGPVNVVAPETLTMKQFCEALGKAMKRPSWLPVPAFMLQLILGEMSEMLLTGQNVTPQKLLKSGYAFQYPRVQEALQAVFQSSLQRRKIRTTAGLV